MTFDEAICSAPTAHKHLLLGNGFSIACRSSIFNYQALFEHADFSRLSAHSQAVFEILKTHDFEEVMDALKTTGQVLQVYDPEESQLRETLKNDADGLREVLVNAIAEGHPLCPSEISDDEYICCRSFLANFERIYSLNYDLLLYWTIIRSELDNNKPAYYDDGFRMPEDGPASYVTWEVENTNRQNVFYLHGALHVFDAGYEMRKFTWKNTGIRLVDQIREALANKMYPLIVTEGTSQQKATKINHNNYLARSYRSLSAITGALFVFGHSLAESDDHILRLIPKSKIEKLYISIYGNPETAENKKIIERALRLGSARTGKKKLEVNFYDAQSAKVWS